MTENTSFFIDQFQNCLLETLRGDRKPVALHEPNFRGNEYKYVKDCLETGWVSSVGAYVDRFEKKVAQFTGSAHAIAVMNGTAALQLACKLVGVGAQHEVLVPTLTFVGTANAVCYLGAIPHFVESSETTLGIDPEKLREHLERIGKKEAGTLTNKNTGRTISALILMHTYGHPAEIAPIQEICEEFGIELIEDAAESLGSFYRGRHTGTFGKVAAISFNGNKTITCGGGGIILTQDEHLAKKAKHLSTTAKVPHPYEFKHDEVGYNFRLPNINAAIGCGQLEVLPEYLDQKRQLANEYNSRFEKLEGLRFFTEPEDCKSNYWLNTVILNPETATLRDLILEKINSAGIQIRPTWTLMHQLPMYEDCPRMESLATTENLAKRILNLPSSPFLAAGVTHGTA